MAIKTVQKKGGLKSVQKSNKKTEKQINDVYLKTNNRLFTGPFIMGMISLTIIILIGGYILYTMNYEIENNPDVTDIGGPPVITDIGPMFVCILVIAFAILLIIKFGNYENEENL